MSVRVLLIGDVHLADKAPSSCTDSYLDDLYGILTHTVEIANDLDVDAVVQAGDMFHIKTPNRTSYNCVFKTIDIIKNFKMPFYIVPGNHDMLHDRLDSVMETQPLGMLYKSGAAHMLNGWSWGDGAHLPIYGVPWLQHWDYDNVQRTLWDFHNVEAPGLVITHAPLFPPGTEPIYEFYSTHDFADHMNNVGSVYYGHIHDPHGVYKVNGVTFCNNGAISRGSLTESNMNRKVVLTLWDTGSFDGEEFSTIDVPHKPAEEIYRIAEVLEKRKMRDDLDEFLESVGATSLESTSAEQVLGHVKTLDNVDPKVVKMIETLLMEHDCA